MSLSPLTRFSSYICLSLLTRLSSQTHLSPSVSFFLRSLSVSLSLSLFHLSPNDYDNDHSSTQLPVQKTLTMRARVRGPWPFIGWRIV